MAERAAPPREDEALPERCSDPRLGARAARGEEGDAVAAHVGECLACAVEQRRWERFVAAEGTPSARLRAAVAAMARGATTAR